jgi:hypothetical protein
MTQYLSSIRIDIHGDREPAASCGALAPAECHISDHKTQIIDTTTGKPIENVCQIEILITPGEPVAAKLTLGEIVDPGTEQVRVEYHEALCPEVELAPLVAFVQQASGYAWQVDGNSWQYLKNGDMSVTFRRRKD